MGKVAGKQRVHFHSDGHKRIIAFVGNFGDREAALKAFQRDTAENGLPLVGARTCDDTLNQLQGILKDDKENLVVVSMSEECLRRTTGLAGKFQATVVPITVTSDMITPMMTKRRLLSPGHTLQSPLTSQVARAVNASVVARVTGVSPS